MSFIPCPNTAKVVMKFLSNDLTEGNNIFHVAASTPGSPTTQLAIATIVASWMNLTYVNDMSASWETQGIEVRDVANDGGPVLEYTTGFPVQGLGGIQSAFQTSYTVTKRTGNVGRSFRGRMYGVGLADGGYDGTTINPTTKGVLQTAWNSLLSQLSTGGFPMVLASYHHNGVPRTTAITTPVTALEVRDKIATQTGRLS